jgi:hypothetical protein
MVAALNAEQVERLIRFVAGRLDDDERIALAAADGDRTEEWEIHYTGAGVDSATGTVAYDEGFPNGRQSEHIARHDPARVLRDVAAKRRLFAKHAPVINGTQGSWTWFEGSESESEKVMQLLSLPYADHPEYDPAWAPDVDR